MMTKYLIAIVSSSALLLLHGCGTVPESPQPASEPRAETVKPSKMAPPPAVKARKAIPKPAVVYRATDTGFKWVTDTSDLKSRHRFRLAWHVIEVNSATRYYGGSVADIDVGTRLRAEGVYRDDVIVADAIYIDRPAVPEEPAAEANPAETTVGEAATLAAANGPAGTPVVSAVSARDTGAGKSEQAAEPSPGAAKEEASKATQPPKGSASSAKSSTRPSAAAAPSAETVKTPPPPAEAREATKLAKAEQRLPQLPAPSEKETSKKPAGPSTGAGAARDFSHLVFDNRILPMSLGHGWTLDRQPDVVDGATRCVLLSPEFPIFDGYYSAKMWLSVNPARAWVKTDSNIDTSYPAQGLRVDGGTLAPFAEKLADKETRYTDAPLLQRLADGHTLTVALGFWPTWPKTKTQTASIDLAGFANAYGALQACSQQQQQAARE